MSVRPVLVKEFRDRARTKTVGVGLLVVVGAISVGMLIGQNVDSSIGNEVTVGRSIFEVLLALCVLLLVFLVPALVSSSIAAERERQTLVPLLLTQVSSRGIVLGKLFSALAIVALILLATLPVSLACVMLGGISIARVVAGYAMLMLVMFCLAAVSIWASAVFRRVQVAATVASLAAAFMLLGLPLLYGFQEGIRSTLNESSGAGSKALLVPNPIVAVASAVRTDSGGNFLSAIAQNVDPGPNQEIVGANGLSRPAKHVIDWPLWLRSALSLATISLVALSRAIRRLTLPIAGRARLKSRASSRVT